MSNVLKVSLQETICTLDGRGWSGRRIAGELGINRETVGRYLLLARLSKPANSTLGSEAGSEPNPAISTPGKIVVDQDHLVAAVLSPRFFPVS